MSKKKNIVYLGCPGFPYGLAEMQKIILISKSLISRGNNVTVVCRNGIHNKKDYPDLKPIGKFQNINFLYSSKEPFRKNRFFIRNFLKVKGAINEFLFLKKASRNNNLDFAILSTQDFFAVIYYSLLSRILGFKTVLNYVEYQSGIKKHQDKISSRINAFLFDKYALKISDSVLPISEFLINKIISVAPNKKYLKIPGLTDFDKYLNIQEESLNTYFLFCGAAGYYEIIYFIIDAFGKLTDESSYLYLVINGKESEKEIIRSYIRNVEKKEKIIVFSNLTEKELFTFYKNAAALLIPLRPTLQDIARFPHKTGEYLASGNPVISTSYGEMNFYFTDMVNMLLANHYEIDLYAEKMHFVLENRDLARKIGCQGKKKAMELFDYRYKAKEIDEFLDNQMRDKKYN